MRKTPYLTLDRAEDLDPDADWLGPVRWATVVCPHGYESGTVPSHPAAEILVTSRPSFKHGTINIWGIEIVREPSGDAPGRLRIAPSIGLHLIERHLPECHLGPGELDFYWKDE